ncbi:MAG: BamA/TamA family outer membrane protein [Myxococcota bacterium]
MARKLLALNQALQILLGVTRLAASESFAYGGDLSLRGALERASLVAVSDGRYLVAGSVELRWRALRQLWLGSFELGPFVDFGVVARARGQLFDDPAVTSGPTVRYVTPVGPLAASYAWPLRRPQAIVTREPRAMPARGRFHLTFGGAY